LTTILGVLARLPFCLQAFFFNVAIRILLVASTCMFDWGCPGMEK
jgi:hypothetical protein